MAKPEVATSKTCWVLFGHLRVRLESPNIMSNSPISKAPLVMFLTMRPLQAPSKLDGVILPQEALQAAPIIPDSSFSHWNEVVLHFMSLAGGAQSLHTYFCGPQPWSPWLHLLHDGFCLSVLSHLNLTDGGASQLSQASALSLMHAEEVSPDSHFLHV